MDKVLSPKGKMILDMTRWSGDTGKLTVLGFSPESTRYTKWECMCECGEIVHVRGCHLRSGDKKMCKKCTIKKERDIKTGRFISVNKKIFDSKIDGLSAVEKKVFFSTPISTPWKTSDVTSDLSRKGITISYKSLEASLNLLREKGLITERPTGHWKRIDIKTEKNTIDKHEETTRNSCEKQDVILKANNRTPIDIIDELMRELRAVIDKAESAALEISQYISGVEEEAKKIEQLKALLKGIGA